MSKNQLPPVLRRWRFAAAIMGVTALAGGGVLLAASSDPATAMAFHPVTSVRVLDTRPATQVGPRNTPLGLLDSMDLVLSTLPDDATAVSLNVTVVDGTEGSFLTIYPSLDARPNVSTINWDSAGAVANSANVNVHTDHSLRIFNLKGTANVVIDLLGYYAPSPVGGGAQGPAGPVGPVGPAGSPAFVSASNASDELVISGDPVAFNDLGSAVGGITPVLGTVDDIPVGFIVPTDGVYRVSFGIVADSSNQVTVQVNGLAPTGGSTTFGGDLVAGGLAASSDGSVLLDLLAGDVISLVNTDSAAALGDLNLITAVGGAGPSVDAWIVVEQLS